MQNNLFNSRRFIFLQFHFNQFYGNMNLDAGEITWKLYHDVYDKDEEESLQANI